MRLRMILVFVLLAAASLMAQTFRGTILGTVTDAQGAVVAGAKVTVKNTGTGLERTTETSADGSYALSALPIGGYDVTITQPGFQTSVTTGVTVDVAGERRVDSTLKPGEVATKVEVSADLLPLVETTTNTLGGVLTAQTVEDMPVNGRDYTKLIYMNPGVSGSPDQISDSPGSFGEFSMNGARGRSNNYLLDGTDMNDGYRNDPAINEAGVFGTPSTILPIDAVAEVNVISNFQPEYGRNAGAVVNIVTKSGTNKLHGSGGDYFRNSALDARNYFNPVQNADGSSNPKAPFHNNQYGASLGGPIVKDKTFFFLDYEGQQEPVGVVTVANVPTGTGLNGALSPADASNPVIAALLARNPWPAPNLSNPNPGLISTDGKASVVSPSFNKLTSFIAKIDHSFNADNLLTGRYFFGDSVSAGLDRIRRPVAWVQYLYADPGAAGFAFVHAYVWIEQGERTSLRLESFRGRVFARRPGFPSQLDRPVRGNRYLALQRRSFRQRAADYSRERGFAARGHQQRSSPSFRQQHPGARQFLLEDQQA
jgi:hypothetical protein